MGTPNFAVPSLEALIEKYGVENPSSASEVKEKRKQTFSKKYGVESDLKIKKILFLYYIKTYKKI